MRIRVGAALLVLWVVAGTAQFSGTWDLSLTLLPTVAFQETRLELLYAFYETWELSLVAYWDDTPVETATLRLKGSSGSLYFSGEAQFDLLSPTYKSAQAIASWMWEGGSLSWAVGHWAPLYAPARPCLQTGASYLEYRLEVRSDRGSVLIRFEDCCSGITWRDLLITLQEIPLCCGLRGSGTVKFSKQAGFEELNFLMQDLALCPGCFVFDLQVSFTTSAKSISITPKLDFPENVCLTLYGEIESTNATIQGIRVQGIELRCELTDCQEVELKTAFTPGGLGFSGEEFEYVRVATCLPGCCGGAGRLEITAFFATSGQFGLSRIVIGTEIPLEEGFTVWFEGEFPQAGDPRLDLRWLLKL